MLAHRHIVPCSRTALAILAGATLFVSPSQAQPAAAEVSPVAPSAVEVDDRPAWLARALRPEDWSANFQTTYVWQMHPGFATQLPDGAHSLSSQRETGYTLTATLFLGHRLWRGAELFFNPEVLQSTTMSDLHGLGGLSNAENQKAADVTARLYSARAFFRQTIRLGGNEATVEAAANQFGGQVSSRRLVVTVGQMALIDVFDNNAFAHDPRVQFFNWALMAGGASDYAADARGYTVGLAVEYYRDDWAFRFGHFAQPKESNGLALDYRLWAHFGEDIEVEHRHVLWGRKGSVRVTPFLSYAKMGGFSDAVAAAQGGIPALDNVRRRDRAKLGFGVGLDQNLTRDLGLFGRYSWNDGRTETYAFAEIDRSLTAGLSMRGRFWFRPHDTVAVAFVQDEISDSHRNYLAAGGLGNFLGDGWLNYRPERVFEAYYSFHAFSGLWITVDGQYVMNPGYNADRGPVTFLGCRLHFEY
ncbi:MAG TPA: carbohydrate porin [Polyangia bacterium]|nr:carbohydrate porin [Polyangia bacterium]